MSSDAIKIRVATLDDAEELNRLNRIFNHSQDTVEALRARLADPARVETPIVAEVDGIIVGFAAVHVVPSVFYPTPRAEVTELFVEEAYRQRGIGRALMAHAEHFAREHGAADLLVLTDFYNHAAQGLYRAMGFENWDIVMYKKLSAGADDDG